MEIGLLVSPCDKISAQSLKSDVMTPRFDPCDARHDVSAGRQVGVGDCSPSNVLNIEELYNRCMGNIQLVQRILGTFQQRIPEELAELEKLLEVRDTEQMARVAHRVKGSSASVSAKGLEQVAAALEDVSRAGRLAEIPGDMERLRDEWARCSHMLSPGSTV